MDAHHSCLQPAVLGGMRLRNRIVFTAANTNFCDEQGNVTDRMFNYMVARAKGGAALLILEATMLRADGRSFTHQLGISSDDNIPGLRRLADAVHAAGAKLVIQLNHCGRQTSEKVTGCKKISASVSSFNGESTRPMSEDDIRSVIADFAKAAVRAKQAGLDGVELHGGNGYLMQQFLSRFTNHRTDRWGGSLGNRLRFTIEVIRAVRNAVGPDFPILHRFGACEANVPDGLTLHETTVAARLLAREPIDAIDVTAGLREAGWLVIPPAGMPEYTHFDKSQRIREAVGGRIPVIGVGRITSLAMADHVLDAGMADFVGVCRSLIADPQFVNRIAAGNEDDVRPCIACNEGCSRRLSSGLDIACAVNPLMGHEGEYPDVPSANPCRIVVIGGGPAGMVAAMTAARRGHDVTLLEQSDALGGRLNVACLPPHKEAIARYSSYLAGAVRKAGVDVRLGCKADAALVKELHADHAIVAIGGREVMLDVPGCRDHGIAIVHAEDVLRHPEMDLPDPVYVIGGGLVGCETAEFLAEAGHEVHVYKRSPNPAGEVEPRTRHILLERLEELGIDIQVQALLSRVDEDGADAVILGQKVRLPRPGAVVMAAGYKPDAALLDALKASGIDAVAVGDSAGGKSILDAARQGFAAGYQF